MRDVLHGVLVSYGVCRAKVEWAEVHRVVRLRVGHAERHAQKASLNRSAASQQINLDGAVAEVVAVEPNHAHTRAFADIQRVLPLDVDNRGRAPGDLPSRIFAGRRQVQIFR